MVVEPSTQEVKSLRSTCTSRYTVYRTDRDRKEKVTPPKKKRGMERREGERERPPCGRSVSYPANV